MSELGKKPNGDEHDETQIVPSSSDDVRIGTPDVVAGSTGGRSAPTSGGESSKKKDVDYTGEMVGEFRLLRKLGKGGMGNVYLAEQTSLGRYVALKLVREDQLDDPTTLERFKTEAMAAASLNHPNIVQVYQIGKVDHTNYIVQEYVQGTNLREWLSKKGPPNLEVAMHIIRQIAIALQKAGESGIVHRDIKPENIMVTPKGLVKVADFGLARVSNASDVNLTQVGVTMGTPTYMSPEQVNGLKADHRSDLYSFGVTCYHLLAGHPPFRGETALSIAIKHVKDEPPALQLKRKDLPKSLCDAVHTLMAKDPAKRYQTAADLLKDLKKVFQNKQAGRAEDLTVSDFEVAPKKPAVNLLSAPRKSLKSFSTFLIVAIGLFAGSAAIGWLTRYENPFEKPAQAGAMSREVPIEPSVEAQVRLARLRGDMEGWQAVIDHFPTSGPHLIEAKEQIALLHLGQKHYDEAEKIFEEFTADRLDPVKAKGYAGLSIVAALRGDYQKSIDYIQFNFRRLGVELDGPLRGLMYRTVGVLRDRSGKQVEESLSTLFEALPPGEEGRN